MGLDILAFACSIDAFVGVYGSRDQAFFETIRSSRNSSIRHYLRLDEQGSSEQTERVEALREIVDGRPLEQFSPSTYGYALIGCLYEIGKELGSNGGSSGRQMYADNQLRRMKEETSVLPSFNVVWPIGTIAVTDWPMIETLRLADVIRRAETMQDILTRVEFKHFGRPGASAWDFLVALAVYYTEAAKLKQDLILIAH